MIPRHTKALLVLVAATGLVTAFAACGAPADPTVGGGSIYGRTPPAAVNLDGGAVAPGPVGTADASTCAPPAAAATCSVKWSTDIYPKVTGTWSCAKASSCHGAGGIAPLIDTTSATTAYKSLLAYKSGGLAFFNPCSADPAASGVLGIVPKQMPLPPGTVSTAEATTLTTWVQCGAPDN